MIDKKEKIIKFLNEEYYKSNISDFTKNSKFTCMFCGFSFKVRNPEKWIVYKCSRCPKCKRIFCILEPNSNERNLKILQEKLFSKDLSKKEEERILYKIFFELKKYSKNILKKFLVERKLDLDNKELIEEVCDKVTLILFERIAKKELYLVRSFGAFLKYKIIQTLYSSKSVNSFNLSSKDKNEIRMEENIYKDKTEDAEKEKILYLYSFKKQFYKYHYLLSSNPELLEDFYFFMLIYVLGGESKLKDFLSKNLYSNFLPFLFFKKFYSDLSEEG